MPIIKLPGVDPNFAVPVFIYTSKRSGTILTQVQQGADKIFSKEVIPGPTTKAANMGILKYTGLFVNGKCYMQTQLYYKYPRLRKWLPFMQQKIYDSKFITHR